MTQRIVVELNPTDSHTFSGTAFSGLLGSAEEEYPVKLYHVRFEPGAKTHWHIHSGTQVLVVTSGQCFYQRAGEPVRQAESGTSVRFRPGERHWHGAGPEVGTEHIAI